MRQVVDDQSLVAAPLALQELEEAEFGALMEVHRRALHVHCYRMLGSVQDMASRWCTGWTTKSPTLFLRCAIRRCWLGLVWVCG
jgi:hypothetical protein